MSYCSRACQTRDWTAGGHKDACSRLWSSKHAATVECFVCFETERTPDNPMLKLGCSCTMEDRGHGHLNCMVKTAVAKAAVAKESGEDDTLPWMVCTVCQNEYQGLLKVKMAERFVELNDSDNDKLKRLAEIAANKDKPDKTLMVANELYRDMLKKHDGDEAAYDCILTEFGVMCALMQCEQFEDAKTAALHNMALNTATTSETVRIKLRVQNVLLMAQLRLEAREALPMARSMWDTALAAATREDNADSFETLTTIGMNAILVEGVMGNRPKAIVHAAAMREKCRARLGAHHHLSKRVRNLQAAMKADGPPEGILRKCTVQFVM